MTRAKVGDIIRPNRGCPNNHGLKFGALCTVICDDYWQDGGSIAVTGPTGSDWDQDRQVLQHGQYKLAKQANAKRDAYANRR
ncbi:hypothetical protein [Pseudomonas phage Misse]|nr:hypothetical protein [Pseudomonas phage Misse]